ncbi:MAG: pyruvate, phosphate dikinase, partial [Desulfobacterales bacterium]
MKVKSKALEVNLADYHVDVTIDAKYVTLQEVMSQYYGLMEGLNTLLKELSHPYKNWRFIVTETRKYSLEYFHLIKNHPKGPAAANLLIDIFFDAVDSDVEIDVKIDAIDNLQLFLQKAIKDLGPDLVTFLPSIDSAFVRIAQLPDDLFVLFCRSYYQVNRLAEVFLDCAPKSNGVFRDINRLLIKFYQVTYDYWLSENDPEAWFEEEVTEVDQRSAYMDFFRSISHSQLTNWKQQLERMTHRQDLESDEMLASLLELPGFNQIVEQYRQIPRHLLDKAGGNGRGRHLKLIFLFHIMSVSGLTLIHRETLRDINQTLGWIIENENYRDIQNLIRKTFTILKERFSMYPATTLNCVLNMGRGVYKTDDIDLINFFIDSVIDLGFATPNFQGVDNNWQIKVNKTHILNIRTWLKLIELDPKRSIRMLSALIIHLSLCGVFIKDIDLFPRDITQFLNSGIGPVFNLAKQLTRLFPVYFNDIGAEGRLRDISTRIDELTQRRDILIHYLRKQSHVESSNRIIDLMEAVLYFWQTRDKKRLAPYLPPAIYDQIDTQGAYIDGVFQIMNRLKDKGIHAPNDLLAISEENVRQWLATIKGAPEIDLERVELAAAFYKMLNQKYNFDLIELDAYLSQLRTEALPDLNRLEQALVETDLHKQLFMLLEYMEKLQKVILSDESFEIRQDIYKKRHITIDIPSMYGSYHEMKFDCLGLAFRIETLVNVLFEGLIEKINLSLITKSTFHQIYSLLRLFDRALKLDGISSKEFERQLEFLAHSLEVKGFTLTQYLDIFKGFAQAVKNIVNDYFNNIHGQNLTRILGQTALDTLLPKFLPRDETIDSEKVQLRVSEIFFRDRIAIGLGLQQLDLFLSRILSTLFQQSYK